ncbi:MAG: GspE/PulE family protein [Myxococcota bacterium]
MSGRFTFDHLLQLLRRRGLLDDEVAEDLARRQSAQRYRLEKDRGITPGRSSLDEVTAPELLASFEPRTPDGATLTEDRIMEVLAEEEALPYVKLDPLELDANLITSTLSRPFARKHRMLPLARRGGRLRVATDDPFNLDALESVRSMTGVELEVAVASKTDILRHIREIYGFRRTLAAAAQDLTGGTDLGNLEQLVKLKSLDEIEATDQHIVNAVEYLLHHAFDQRASDLHIEPKREYALVRLRIDGVLHTVQRVPKVVHAAMVSRIKTMARLDIAEKRRPQDGRIKTRHKDSEIELRVSTLPVAFGEKMVLRIFDPEVLLQDLDNLGFTPTDLERFNGFIGRPHGLLLVTGPTGSGKTTTLYSALQVLASDRINISTIEDPIEMVLEEFNQTAVNPRAGITFASSLRTLLRQDPDVIMVGEIRDQDTARHAVQAALTGHLVLSTLHTNDSASALTRMVELGVEPFLVASTVVGVMAQRLVRTICRECKEQTTLSEEQLGALGLPIPDAEEAPRLPVWYGKGCVECRHTGLRGRSGVFEVLPVSERIRRHVIEHDAATDILRTARQDGMKTLRENAIKKLARGDTSFEEVLRVTVEQ